MDLILHSKGVSLKVENRLFRVFDGDLPHTYHPTDITAIRLGSGTSVTGAALLLAIESGIDVTIEKYSGDPVGRIWSPNYGSIATIRKKQWAYVHSFDATSWVISVLQMKLEMQVALVSTFLADETIDEQLILRTVRRMQAYKPRLVACEGAILETIDGKLRGIEGKVAAHYFGFLGKNLPLHYRFDGRSQRPARDMFNCMLNYGYGVLYGMIERELTRAGLDPYAGVLHKDRYNTPALSFDVIEGFRVWVDSLCVNLCRLGVIFPEFFDVDETNGAWRFNAYGKRIFITAFNDYLDEIIGMNKLDRTRRTHITLYCQNLAQRILKNNG